MNCVATISRLRFFSAWSCNTAAHFLILQGECFMNRRKDIKNVWALLGIITFLMLLLFLILFILIPYILWGKSSWDWGSFIGGTTGGIGTIIAVCITVNQTRKIQEENRLENEERIQEENNRVLFENTLIVYYDLKFALEDLYKFSNTFFNMDDGKRANGFYEGQFQNTYFDKDWIHTIPKIANLLSPEALCTVYDLYGNISTMLRHSNMAKYNTDDELMFIKSVIFKFYNSSQNLLMLKKEVGELMDILKSNLHKYGKYSVENNFIAEIKYIRLEK